MSNIYIRLPFSRCQFYRYRDNMHPLSPKQPIKFSEFSEEFYIIKHSLFNKRNKANKTADERVFSQMEWDNMLKGRDPFGKVQVMQPNNSQWLKYKDIVTILGEKKSDKSNLYDYLCIKLPTEVLCVDTVFPVTSSWCIDIYGYNRLVEMINNDFKRSIIDWAIDTFDYCTVDGRIIARANSAMLERFLMRYNITPTMEEKDSMRRVIDRWLKGDFRNYNSYSSFDLSYKDQNEKSFKIDNIEWTL